MTETKAKQIQKAYQITRIILLIALLLGLAMAAKAQVTSSNSTLSNDERLARLEQQIINLQKKDSIRDRYMPQLHGILRGKYEYEPELDASRFEVRNARLAVSGVLPLRSEYKLEVDLQDETEMKMKDAWVRVNPWKSLRISLGQQRMPFSIDAHRNPSAQYFANRSFIAKQVGDMRDVGGMIGYTAPFRLPQRGEQVPTLIIDAGLFNGSNINDQKTAWHSDWNYSARLQILLPLGGGREGLLAIMPSIQHDAIAKWQAHYTSLDFGAYYEMNGWHIEGEYLHKTYMKNAFDDCASVDAMVIYKQNINNEKSFIQSISYLGRYDWMQDHASGKDTYKDGSYLQDGKLKLTDAERHRMTLGMTFSVRNKYFPTDLRLNYEKYWYPHGGAKESEQDKLVAEISIKF